METINDAHITSRRLQRRNTEYRKTSENILRMSQAISRTASIGFCMIFLILISVSGVAALSVDMVVSPNPVLAGNPINFTCTLNNASTPNSHNFDFDDGNYINNNNNATVISATHTYALPGVYTTVCSFTMGMIGVMSETNVTVLPSIDNPPSVTIITPLSGSTFNTDSVFMNAIATDDFGVASMEFRLTNGQWIPYTAPLDVHLTNGPWTITVRATDSTGQISEDQVSFVMNNSMLSVITTEAFPTLAGQNLSTGCRVGPGNIPYTFTLDHGDLDSDTINTTSDFPTFTHIYSTPGTYTQRCTVTDAAGRSGYSEQTVTILAPECMDGIDNADVEDILADFPADPGCADGYDNDETDPVLPQCSDGVDNDGDTFIDMLDPGCTTPIDNNETDPFPPAQCSDGMDNDFDGFIDFPADIGCTDPADNDETNPALPPCSDGIDNDGDGYTDYPADFGCSAPSDIDEINNGLFECNNGADDDGDLWADQEDPDCTSFNDTSETGTFVCGNNITEPGEQCDDGNALSGDGCSAACMIEFYECNDGLDNDGDALIDYPSDPGCNSMTDNNETDPTASCPVIFRTNAVDGDFGAPGTWITFQRTHPSDPYVGQLTGAGLIDCDPGQYLSGSYGWQYDSFNSSLFMGTFTMNQFTQQYTMWAVSPISHLSEQLFDYGCHFMNTVANNATLDEAPLEPYTSAYQEVYDPAGVNCPDLNKIGGTFCTVDSECLSDLCINNACVSICGNNIVETGEECDDGNALLGDGCSAACMIEYACSDTIDNDGDGLIDAADPGCSDAGVYNATDNDEFNVPNVAPNLVAVLTDSPKTAGQPMHARVIAYDTMWNEMTATFVVDDSAPPEDVIGVTIIANGLSDVFNATMGLAKLTSQLGGDYAQDLIIVGHPCYASVRNFTAPYVDCNAVLPDSGEALVKLFSLNGNIQVVVMSNSPYMRLVASRVLQNYQNYSLTGDTFCVTGTLASPSIQPTCSSLNASIDFFPNRMNADFSQYGALFINNPVLNYNLVGPAFVEVVPGDFVWNTTAGDVGLHNVSVVVSDGFADSSNVALTVEVLPPPAPKVGIIEPAVGMVINQSPVTVTYHAQTAIGTTLNCVLESNRTGNWTVDDSRIVLDSSNTSIDYNVNYWEPGFSVRVTCIDDYGSMDVDQQDLAFDICTVPVDGMTLTTDTLFCPGTYNLPNGITLDLDAALDCNGAQLIGNGVGNGITIMGGIDLVYWATQTNNWQNLQPILSDWDAFFDTITPSDVQEIFNCDISNYHVGINMTAAKYTDVMFNTVHDNNIGILDFAGERVNIRYNVLYDNALFGIAAAGQQVDIIENNLSNGQFGIGVLGDDQAVLGNRVTGMNEGVVGLFTNFVIVSGNVIEDNRNKGISILDSDYAQIVQNIMYNNTVGVHFSGLFTKNNGRIFIYNNTIADNTRAGIQLKDAWLGHLIDRILRKDSYDGFTVQSSNVQENILENPGAYDLVISDVKNNGHVIGNSIYNNSMSGLGIYDMTGANSYCVNGYDNVFLGSATGPTC